MPVPTIPRRVTLLCSGVRAGNDLLALLGEEHAVNVISAPLELARGGPPADVVVVDVPAEDRPAVCQELRYHYRGPLIVLLQPADNSHDLPPDHSRTLLTRPFSMRELAVALAASVPAPPASDPAGRLGLVLPHGTQEPRTNPAADWERTTVVQAVPRLVRSLGERRLVRVSAILAAAAIAFIVAFGLANQGDRCPPRCHEPIGADDLTSTSSDTTVQAVGGGLADPTTTDPSGRPTAVAGSRTDVTTSGATRISPTTSPSSGVPGPTSSPGPTRAQPSASSTTAPTTTRPRPTTTTTTSSTTTTTTTDLPARAPGVGDHP